MTLKLSDHFFEESKTLGEPLAVFKTGIAFYAYAASVLFLAGSLVLLYAIAPLFAGVQGRKDASPDLKETIAGITLITFGVANLRKCWQRPRFRVLAFQHGLIRMEREGIDVVRWEDVNRLIRVNEFYKFNPSRNLGEGMSQVILIRRDGRTFTFNEMLSRFRDFSKLVKEHTLRHMLPPALEAFKAGETIRFGDVSIGPDGIHYSSNTLPWDIFERAEAAKGQLLLYRRNDKKPLGRLELSQVPNFHVLLALVENLRGRHDHG